jgi:hypothetical protein
MIFDLLSSNNVYQQSLALFVESLNLKATLRRVERFFLKKNFITKRLCESHLLSSQILRNV